MTTRVVHLDTGQGEPITYTSVGVEPVEVGEAEFKVALTQLLLDMRLDVAFRESEEADERGWVRSRTLLASAKGLADSGLGSSPESLYTRICPDTDECLTLVGGTGLSFGRKDRTLMALSFALDTVWESVEAEVGKMLNPVALKAMLTSAALTVLLTMTLPEPVTKVIAVALTAAMLDDVANQVRLNAHQGPHPQAYHQAVMDRLQKALGKCKSEETCRPRLVEELARIANDLLMPGSDLRRLIVTGEG